MRRNPFGSRGYAPEVTGRSKAAPLSPSPPDLDEGAGRPSPLPDELVDAELEERAFSGDAGGRDASGITLLACRLEDVDLSAATLRRAHLRDVRVEGGSWANVDASEVRLSRAELRGVRVTGGAFTRAALADVAFLDCRMDLASFRFATLERVLFRGCRMEEVDLSGAEATSVLFDGCDLSRASLSEATFARTEMRGCTLDGIGNPERLRGVAMPWGDVLRNAATLAAGVGVRVLEE